MVELIKISVSNYSQEFFEDQEKEFILSIYNSGGLELLRKIYESLPNWDSKANFVKYFMRTDCQIHDKSLLERFQKEYYNHLVENGAITEYCKT